MDFRFTKEEEEFRKEVDEFMRCEMTKDVMDEVNSMQGFGPHCWEFLHRMGEKGWVCPQWPKDLGGLGAPYMTRFIIEERASYHRAPQTLVAGIAGEVIRVYGNEEMKNKYLLPIAKGEIEFALGYTEPESGTDLASMMQMRAVRQGDEYIINGQKVFNTRCHWAQYHWLMARTAPNAVPKHRGLSLFIVDLKSPGITIRPLMAMGVLRTNAVFYDDVHVPAKNLVGEENRGWYEVMVALEEERVGMSFVHFNERVVHELLEYYRHAKIDGMPLSKDPLVRQRIAQVRVEFLVANLFRYRCADMLAKGEKPEIESCITKIFSTEAFHRMVSQAVQMQGLYGQLRQESKWAKLPVDREYLSSIMSLFVAGSNEILRNVLAQRGLGLPRD